MILLEFPLDSSGNSTGSVEIPLDSVEIPLDSSGIPLDSSGNSIGFPLDSIGNSSDKTAVINPLYRTTKFTLNSVSYL